MAANVTLVPFNRVVLKRGKERLVAKAGAPFEFTKDEAKELMERDEPLARQPVIEAAAAPAKEGGDL